MKLLITTVLFALLSTTAFAKGVASLKVKENLDAKKEQIALGLTIDESVVGPLSYHSYTGIAAGEKKGGSDFLTSHQLDCEIKKFILSPGAQLNYTVDGKNFDKIVFVKLGYQLW